MRNRAAPREYLHRQKAERNQKRPAQGDCDDQREPFYSLHTDDLSYLISHAR